VTTLQWNGNFLQYGKKLLRLQDLLLRHNMVNIMEAPARSFNCSTSLIDVMAIDKFHRVFKNKCGSRTI